MRSNLVIALGDLAVRWPNTLEPWTASMYGVLDDPNEGAQLLFESTVLRLQACTRTQRTK